MIYLVMGVSGCGKTLIGTLLARRLGLPFYDADDFHSQVDIAKMKSGVPLADHERLPWLRAITAQIPQWEKQGGAVLACSALKEQYRVILKSAASRGMLVIHLKAPLALIQKRLEKRKHPFFPARLLPSQFAILEEPDKAITVSVAKTPRKIIKEIMGCLAAQSRHV